MKQKVVLFGAAGGGKRLYDEISINYDILCFTDNDSLKWGGVLNGVVIKSPQEALKELYDKVIITSAPGCDSIYEQLLQMSVPEENIITTYVYSSLKSRIVFLESFAKILENKNNEGSCAEAGVFQGDFAKHINRCFPNKKLYLFDTFDGFVKEDIQIEEKLELSKSKVSDYSNSSIDLVMAKMPYPEQCIFKKGYFPDTAKKIKDTFLFVNLDMDLYQPTLNGLYYFRDKMISGGIILIHDYFAENFKGPKLAVDKFLKDSNELSAYPIGDGISIMITGF